MAKAETNVVHAIMQSLSKRGAVTWKNVRGKFRSFDGKRIVAAGLLTAGASDLIGFVPVTITPEMVGQTVAVFLALEVKTDLGIASREQQDFIAFVTKNGGYAGVARSPEQAEKIIG
ncbi:MAG: VRR-NUC domain-containing protein [Janthinobacterium lividum]